MLMWHQIHRKYRYILPLSNSQKKKVRLNRSRKIFSLVGKGLHVGILDLFHGINYSTFRLTADR